MDNKKRHVVWIDQNNDKIENNQYLKDYSKELKDFSFTLVTSVKEGYNCLSKFKFQLIYVILSGRLAEEFLDIYEANLQELSIITLNIIFCYNKKYHQSKKYANDPFYNPGGVVTEFEEVIHFLKLDNKYPINKQKYFIDKTNINYSPFEYIEDKIENIAFPVILKKFSSRFVNEEDLENFKKFLLNYYYDTLEGSSLADFLSYKIKIPFYLYSKIFLRLYTGDSYFYKDLGLALLKNDFTDFKQFIFILYYGLIRNNIKDVHDIYLYRGINIDISEYKILCSHRLLLTRKFDSFAKRREIAMQFMKFTKRPNTKSVLFVVHPLKSNSNLTVTNIDATQISFFNEEEVIFLPFSGLEISKIKEENDYTIIHLNYLNKFEKKIIDYIDAKSKDNVQIFLQELIGNSQSIFKNILPAELINLIIDYENKKNVLWIDQYSRCKAYNDHILKFSKKLNDFYFEKATTIKEAFIILSNYEFNIIYIIINDKLSDEFFAVYEKEIKKLSVVTANIIFCDEEPKLKKNYMNDPFLNPGKIVTDFSRVVEYLNSDECAFKDILKLKNTIDSSFAGKNYGNIFKEVNEKQIGNPKIIIKKMISHLPNQESISKFQNFVYKYGKYDLSISVKPSREKKIDLPLYIYPKFYMKLYGLQTQFFKDINKYLSNQGKDFGLYDTFITILYYGLSENMLINSNEFPFYRGGIISRKEFKILEENFKMKKNFYYCKNFLSFSRSEAQANVFLEDNLECDQSLFPTKFIVEGYEKTKGNENISHLISNAEMRHYSSYAYEEEVLFFPLSSFKVTKISDDTYLEKKIKIIELNYVGVFLK